MSINPTIIQDSRFTLAEITTLKFNLGSIFNESDRDIVSQLSFILNHKSQMGVTESQVRVIKNILA